MQQLHDYIVKLLVIGNSKVGKTSIIKRFVHNIFNDQFISTIGLQLVLKSYESNRKTIKLQIFDGSGQERYRSIIQSYSKGFNGFIFVYDITNRQSFEHIRKWITQLTNKHGISNVVMVLVGNKSDLEGSRQVSVDEGIDIANELGINYFETSAKQAVNVEKAFTTLAKEVLSKRHSANNKK